MASISSHNIVIGCAAGVLSSASQSVGLILQRKSHLHAIDNAASSASYYNRSLWHMGLFIFLFSNLFGSSIQLTSLPLILLSPLQSIGLVFNTLFNHLLLNEPFTNISFWGTVIITFGAFFIAYCGNTLEEPNYNLEQFTVLLKNLNFLLWISFLVGCITLIFIILVTINKQICQNIITDHISKHPDNFYVPLLTLVFQNDTKTLIKIKGLLYGLVSGILSAFSLLLAKSSIEILINTFVNKNWKTLNNSISYLIVIIFLSLGISQLILLNKGLKKISTSTLYPLVFCIYNLISISNSLIFFKQWNQLSNSMLGLLLLGTLLIMMGVFLLSLQASDDGIEDRNMLNISSSSSLESNKSVDLEQQDPTESETALEVSSNNSIGTIINNTPNQSNNSIIPFFKRTQTNINNASKKVSGFLKKPDHISPQNNENSPLLNENSHHLNEYVSFDSLRDMNSTYSPSISGAEYDFHQDQHDSSTVSNLLQPIIGKIKRQTSMLELPNDTSNKTSSSYKSSLSFSLKNLTQSFDSPVDENHERLKNKNLSSMREQFDDDYNPNNTFNYSFSNTLEEIQNQINAIDSNNSVVPQQDLLSDDLNYNHTFHHDNRALPKSFSVKSYHQQSQQQKPPIPPLSPMLDYKNKHHSVGSQKRVKSPIHKKHRRVFSYEQNLLLEELRKQEE